MGRFSEYSVLVRILYNWVFIKLSNVLITVSSNMYDTSFVGETDFLKVIGYNCELYLYEPE
jgi:hypothetical protein